MVAKTVDTGEDEQELGLPPLNPKDFRSGSHKPKPTFEKVLEATKAAMDKYFNDTLDDMQMTGTDQLKKTYERKYGDYNLGTALGVHVALKMAEHSRPGGDESVKNFRIDNIIDAKIKPSSSPDVYTPLDLRSAIENLIDKVKLHSMCCDADAALKAVDAAIDNAMGVGKSRG